MSDSNVHLQMIRDFQCTGCVSGPACNPNSQTQECPSFSLDRQSNSCIGHVMGTSSMSAGPFALGMPVGFNKTNASTPRSLAERKSGTRRSNIFAVFFYGSNEECTFPLNHLNVPVWYLEEDGHFFIRVFSPRTNSGIVIVIKGGDKSIIPETFSPFDVAEFQSEID